MADVFISYRKADRARAQALANALKIQNLDVWWDTALETGQTFDEKIQAVLEQCKAVIVLWSKESVKSDWVRAESSIGRERGILVPVMIQPVNIPVPFNLLHTADLIGWNGDRAHPGYRDVVKQVKELAGKTSVKSLKPPPNPALRNLWRAVAAVAVIAVIGASVWVFRPWESLAPRDPVIEAQKERDASVSKLAAFGVQPGDLQKFSGRHIARQTFNASTRSQLDAEAASGDPAVLALKCAVDFWATPDGLPDWEGASDICQKAADAGEPAAHVYHGHLLEDAAVYAPSDEERAGMEASATGEFRKAAEKGFGWGEIEYGWRLREGAGVPADPAAAETLFKSAQAKGMPAADLALGRLYLSGEVASPLDPNEAFALVRKAADAGDASAQFYAAQKLTEGWDFTPDYEAALAYYKAAAAADEGDPSWQAARFIEDTEARIAEQKAAASQPTPPDPAPN